MSEDVRESIITVAVKLDEKGTAKHPLDCYRQYRRRYAGCKGHDAEFLGWG